MNKLPPHDANGFYLNGSAPRYCEPETPDEKEVETALAYLSRLDRTKHPNLNSYSLKHLAEKWGKRHGMQSYISNGALIEAAVRLGIPCREVNQSSINALIGVSIRSVRRLDLDGSVRS